MNVDGSDGGAPGSGERDDSPAALAAKALDASDLPGSIDPVLRGVVRRTVAAGALFLQAESGEFLVRSRAGEGPGPEELPDLRADDPFLRLVDRDSPLYLEDVASSEAGGRLAEAGLSGVAGLAVREQDRLIGAILAFTPSPHRWTAEERHFLSAVAELPARLLGQLVEKERARAARERLMYGLGRAVEYRDYEMEGHTERVTELALQVGRNLGIPDADLRSLRWGSYLHDVGMLSIPDAILHKGASLDEEEWEVVRSHVEVGHRFAASLGFLPPASLGLIRHHHEQWDGSGYPGGLEEAEIPRLARLFAVCDAYDAMTTERPYRDPRNPAEAIRELRRERGEQFDPAVVDAFVELRSDWDE